jgi:hypothetical protein
MPETQTARAHRQGRHVLPGFLQPHPAGVVLRVWCRWCCVWHLHHTAEEPPGDVTEHQARCYAPDSPYRTYLVRVSPVPFEEAAEGVVVATMAQRWAIGAGLVSSAVQRLRDQPGPRPL